MKKIKPREIVPGPKFLYDENGKKVGVSLKREDYEKLLDLVNDYEDYKTALKLYKNKKS
ncbi:hypothetical protein M1446_04250 [Candidatus Dependentiae bacterium]|nr:hypothetical protein [Candidatus Dependentiae bacterium]